MAFADLVARLEQDVRSQVEAITRQAEAEVRAIEAAAAQAAADATASHLERRRAERRRVQQRDLARVRRQAHARELEARHVVMARILDRARSLMADASGSVPYVAALPAHLAEALSYLEGVPARVRCGAATASHLRPLLGKRPDVTLVVDESIGPGLIAEAADESVVVDNTLAARLSRLHARLAVELLAEVGHVVR